MIFGLLLAFLIGGSTVQTVNYAECEKVKFKGEGCKISKELNKVGK